MTHFTGGAISGYTADTATVPLWETGFTYKTFFSADSIPSAGIMTDTLHYYPANANHFFQINLQMGLNTIVDFWHRYQTDSPHAGGLVEYSTDGSTWQNVIGLCSLDTFWGGVSGTFTDGFYTFADTLFNGSPAFMGNSGGTVYSRIQFFQGLPLKTTSASDSSGPCDFIPGDTLYIRFRFISDSTVDSLAGWKIDSMKVEIDHYSDYTGLHDASIPQLKVYPQPSYDGQFHFPYLLGESEYSIEIFTLTGTRVMRMPYTEQLDLSSSPPGVYVYKVSNGYRYYTGRLVRE